jgi:hypothetical protein
MLLRGGGEVEEVTRTKRKTANREGKTRKRRNEEQEEKREEKGQEEVVVVMVGEGQK